MRGDLKSLLFRYGLSVLLFAAVLGISLALRYFGIQINLTIPVVIAIVGASWFGGRGPGILITVLIVLVAMFSRNRADETSAIPFYVEFASVLALLLFVVLLISGRKLSEERLRHQSELFRTTLESIGDAVITTDQAGKVTFMNAIAERVTRRRSSDVIGSPLGEVYSLVEETTETPIVDVFEAIRERKETISFTDNVLLCLSDGSRLPISDSCAPIMDNNGRFFGSVIVFQDDSPRRETEQALKAAEHRQQQSQKLEAIGTLTGGVAHDFNNLLTAILGYTQLAMRKMGDNAAGYENLLYVEKAGNRAAELTKKLLAFSRRQPMESRLIDLNHTISEMLKILSRLIGENIRVTFNGSADLMQVNADPTQIEQVIMNLSINARDAMPNGGRLSIETRNVVLDEYYCRQYPNCEPGKYVQILVSDTGVGMDRETKDRIFEPFFTTKDVDQGTGLGLSMVYGVVKQHHGQINVYSEQGHGSIFKIYLPVTPQEEKLDGRPLHTSLIGGGETILVADDEEDLRSLTSDVLGALGYKVFLAENGERAITQFEENPGQIDLLLLDVVMPGLGGVDVYRKIATNGKRIPVIFMTGYSAEILEDSKAKISNLGQVPVLQKPYTLDALGRIVRETLDRHALNQNAL